MKPSMQVVNNINNSIFCSLVRQMKLYIKQQAVVADELIDEVNNFTYFNLQNFIKNINFIIIYYFAGNYFE